MSNNKYTKTSAFLIYAAGLDPTDFPRSFENAYLEDKGYEKPSEVEDLYIVFHAPKGYDEDFEDFCEIIRDVDNFLDEYDVPGYCIFRLSLLEEWKHIKEELKTSKYSKIDREYVEKFFPKKIYTGTDKYGKSIWKPSKNYQILTKADELLAYWEEKLDITLPEEAEAWSKLDLNEEIFRIKDTSEPIIEKL